MKNTDNLLENALEIADLAYNVISDASSQRKNFNSKGEISNLITKTDLEVDKLITNFLSEKFPEHNIVSEEQGNNKKNSDYCWYIDPIDGTNNFVHNYPSYATSIGLFYLNKPLLGVVYDIPNNEKFYAIKNEGSYCNNKRISVSQNDFSNGLYVTGFIPYDEKYIDKNLQVIKNINLNSHGVRRLGAASLDMCHVAKGIVEGFWEYNLQPWDTAAGNIIISEAGGKITDDANNPYNFNKCIVASNSLVHSDFVNIISKS